MGHGKTVYEVLKGVATQGKQGVEAVVSAITPKASSGDGPAEVYAQLMHRWRINYLPVIPDHPELIPKRLYQSKEQYRFRAWQWVNTDAAAGEPKETSSEPLDSEPASTEQGDVGSPGLHGEQNGQGGVADSVAPMGDEDIPCPNANRGCDYRGSQKGVNAHMGHCKWKAEGDS